ncbi:hypoxanthine phosphoribosyltransferase [Aerococcus sanguinicola]|uniref:Hypoxanthine phosphoribosyltransferase n=1 Tax=Aerococcus sanguinicola TaxID=119206 RepID=A0A120I953_9LACT|nr:MULTISPECIES: hypoxanthine phosphoribosyltransferase [Aerococcus]AMB93850.1 hypoxanthine phosphoribosyltransferase [Aerococcus sanguinicola]MDK7050294.1 hypoxanthine phosphoribosyltransferase [Aerococcus sanguinicola]OFT94940.1 hypoxanthine phosphoribosyltransferase [Aerococcus sp. HMSC23C02]PKZ21416.1 hypoxanthine phosphoribosyltransferase [Aerococcus sanguinicola]
MTHPNDDIQEVLLSQEEIAETVDRLGQELTEDYRGKNPLVIGILKGSVVFMTDLVRRMDCPLEMDFMSVSSYGSGTESSGQVKILKDLDQSVEGRHILIVEDIIDTGRTLKKVCELMAHRKAASVKVCALLNKPERRVVDMTCDYTGRDVPDEFVVGYGLDYNEKYRALPYIGILKAEVYS